MSKFKIAKKLGEGEQKNYGMLLDTDGYPITSSIKNFVNDIELELNYWSPPSIESIFKRNKRNAENEIGLNYNFKVVRKKWIY